MDNLAEERRKVRNASRETCQIAALCRARCAEARVESSATRERSREIRDTRPRCCLIRPTEPLVEGSDPFEQFVALRWECTRLEETEERIVEALEEIRRQIAATQLEADALGRWLLRPQEH